VGHRRIVKKGQGGASLQSKTGGAKGGQGGATKKMVGRGLEDCGSEGPRKKMTFFCLSCSSSQRHHTPVSCQNMCEELLHTAEELLHTRWSEGGQNNLAAAWAQWKHHCDTINAGDSVGGQLDVLNPTPPQLVEFLRAVRKAATASADNGRPWKLQHPHKNNFPGYQLS
jgi:hypothetical protein